MDGDGPNARQLKRPSRDVDFVERGAKGRVMNGENGGTASGLKCVWRLWCVRNGAARLRRDTKRGGGEKREGGSRVTQCVAGGEMRVRRPGGCEVEGLAPAYGSPLRGAGPFIHMGPGRLGRALGGGEGSP